MTGSPVRRYGGWMQAIHWSVCSCCGHRIGEGDWQGLADVPDHGRRWVHRACAIQLGVPDTPPPVEPERDALGGVLAPPPRLRLLIVGSPAWPRERAVEVRDAIAALARGHRHVQVVHTARTSPDTGRLVGVDAWAELTATRLGLEVEHLADHHDVDAAGAVVVVVAFPLTRDPATGRACTDPGTAKAVTRAEDAGLPVLTHSSTHPRAGSAG